PWQGCEAVVERRAGRRHELRPRPAGGQARGADVRSLDPRVRVAGGHRVRGASRHPPDRGLRRGQGERPSAAHGQAHVRASGRAGEFEGVAVAVEAEPRGTGAAFASARQALEGFEGDVLVLSGDTPLLTPELLEELVAEHRRTDADVTILSFEPQRPFPYGR